MCLLLEAAKALSLQSFQPELRLDAPFASAVSAASAITELIAAKQSGNRRSNYLHSLKGYTTRFVNGRENEPISSFTTADVEACLCQIEKPYSRQTWLNRISTLFSFCVRRGYIQSNPCDRIERITVDKKPPIILKPEQAKLLMNACPSVMRPYLILGLFAGIRPEEIMRLDWSQVNLETKTAFVDGKTRRRRYVPLEPIAVKLLKVHPVKTGLVAPSKSTVTRWKHKARALLGLKRFPQDLLRHTAASYLIALYGDAGKVATMLGNSSKILLTHYHEPVTKDACEKFWNL